jgi:acetyl-CoA acetyltransferase
MQEVVIVEGARTPFGRALKGSFRQTRPEDLAAAAVRAAPRGAGSR